MAKKDSKKDTKKSGGKKDKATAGAVEAIEAVRSAVERTFTATAEGAQSLRGPAQGLASDVAVAANRIREVLEDRVLDELKGLRSDIEGLARRVAALEIRGRGSSTPASPAGGRRPAAARKPGARRTTTTARSTGRATAAAKPATSRARKAPAKASGADSAAKTTAARGTGTGEPAAAPSTSATRESSTDPASGGGGTTSST